MRECRNIFSSDQNKKKRNETNEQEFRNAQTIRKKIKCIFVAAQNANWIENLILDNFISIRAHIIIVNETYRTQYLFVSHISLHIDAEFRIQNKKMLSLFSIIRISHWILILLLLVFSLAAAFRCYLRTNNLFDFAAVVIIAPAHTHTYSVSFS